MSQVLSILSTILPVFIMLFIGILCRRKQLLTRDGIDALKTVIVNFALPAVMLGAFATASYTLMDVIIPLIMYVLCIAAWALGKIGAKALRIPSKLAPFLTTSFEAGMLGYALFAMLYGGDATPEFARIDLGQVLFTFTLYKFLIGLTSEEQSDSKQLLREMITSPVIIAVLTGIVIGATGLYHALTPSGVSALFDACVDFVAAPTSAIILLTIGYDLVFEDIPWADTIKAVGLRFVIMMVLRVVLLFVLNILFPGTAFSRAVTMMFILPPPYVLPVFADDEKERTFISSALSVSTLLSIACFVVLAVLAS